MNFEQSQAMAANRTVKGKTKMVLAILCVCADRHTAIAHPGYGFLMGAADVTEKTLVAALKELQTAGHITVLRPGQGRSRPAEFLVHVDGLNAKNPVVGKGEIVTGEIVTGGTDGGVCGENPAIVNPVTITGEIDTGGTLSKPAPENPPTASAPYKDEDKNKRYEESSSSNAPSAPDEEKGVPESISSPAHIGNQLLTPEQIFGPKALRQLERTCDELLDTAGRELRVLLSQFNAYLNEQGLTDDEQRAKAIEAAGRNWRVKPGDRRRSPTVYALRRYWTQLQPSPNAAPADDEIAVRARRMGEWMRRRDNERLAEYLARGPVQTH